MRVTDVVLHLQPLGPRERFKFVGELCESLATIRPVAVIVLDVDGEPIGCASCAGPDGGTASLARRRCPGRGGCRESAGRLGCTRRRLE
jgi:hypothetical protein